MTVTHCVMYLVVDANTIQRTGGATLGTENDIGLFFDLPHVGRKKVTAAFECGFITSDGGVPLLALTDRRTGIFDPIAAMIV